MSRPYFGSQENITPFVQSEFGLETALNLPLTCETPKPCGAFGCNEYYCRWTWDATGEVEGSMPAWFIAQDDPGTLGCPEGCGSCEYPDFSGLFDRQTYITYCSSLASTTSPP